MLLSGVLANSLLNLIKKIAKSKISVKNLLLRGKKIWFNSEMRERWPVKPVHEPRHSLPFSKFKPDENENGPLCIIKLAGLCESETAECCGFLSLVWHF